MWINKVYSHVLTSESVLMGDCANTLLWVSVLIRCGCVCRKDSIFCCFISLHIRGMWETTVMHKQISGWTVNFGPNFPESPFLELKTTKPSPPPPPFQKTSDLGWPKFTPDYPPFRKLQIWDDQSLLQNTPPFRKTSDLGWPKFTPKYPPPSFRKTSDLGWPKFTSEYPLVKIVRESKSESFRIPRVSEYRELLHVETLSNPDNY